MLTQIIKKTIPIIVILFFTGCSLFDSDDDSKTNLLFNSNVEMGNTQEPSSWDSYAEDDYIAEWSTEEFTSPGHSLKISASIPNYGVHSYWVQSIHNRLVFDKEMILRVKVKVENVEGTGVYFKVNARGDRGSYVSQTNTNHYLNIRGTTDWTEYEIEVEPFPETMEYANIFLVFGANTTGTAYFDDITLEY